MDNILSRQNHLSDLEDSQVEMQLLCSCLSLCKINHLIRTVPPGRVTKQLSRFDHGVRHCLEKMFNSSMSDACWKQATLPVCLGGLGLREASRTALAAFIGSCNSTHKLLSQLLGHATSFVDGSEHVNLD